MTTHKEKLNKLFFLFYSSFYRPVGKKENIKESRDFFHVNVIIFLLCLIFSFHHFFRVRSASLHQHVCLDIPSSHLDGKNWRLGFFLGGDVLLLPVYNPPSNNSHCIALLLAIRMLFRRLHDYVANCVIHKSACNQTFPSSPPPVLMKQYKLSFVWKH